jgi:gas vesicle protein
METNKINYSGLWKGLMAGSILGTAAGILLAPKSGKELRSDIRAKKDKALEDTRRVYSDSRARVRNALACVAGISEKALPKDFESGEEIIEGL